MKTDIWLAGVGGQGVLSLAHVIAAAARHEGLHVKQGEVHGMSQRGGAVHASLRLSDRPIESDLIPHGTASMIVSMEPVEALRALDMLSPGGTVVSSTDPVRNVPDYPPLEGILDRLRALPSVVLVDADRLARQAGAPRAGNVVLVGAVSHLLPIAPAVLEDRIREVFAAKGPRVVEANLRAFQAGREAVPCRAPE